MEILSASDGGAVAAAIAALDAGALVVVPGDLAYLVVCDALDDDAVERLFTATGRGADRPLTTFISGYPDLHHVAYGGADARALADAHWPGPATLVLRARPWLPDMLTAGQETVRVSAPRGFLADLARHFGPLAGAGAQRQGATASLDARTARDAIGADARLVVDGGVLAGGEVAVFHAPEG